LTNAGRLRIGIALVSEASVRNVTGWMILDEEDLSLHKYIVFYVNALRSQQKPKVQKVWAYRNLTKLNEKLRLGPPLVSDDAASACNQVISWATEACDRCMPRAGGSIKRRPVLWWSADIAEQRRSCLKARRAYTRKRKRADEADSITERDNSKQQRNILATKIKEAKDKH